MRGMGVNKKGLYGHYVVAGKVLICTGWDGIDATSNCLSWTGEKGSCLGEVGPPFFSRKSFSYLV
jgi:hypothetical protein